MKNIYPLMTKPRVLKRNPVLRYLIAMSRLGFLWAYSSEPVQALTVSILFFLRF